MCSNQLCLNADKTHLMVGGTSQKLSQLQRGNNISVTMSGVQLGESSDKCEKVLGVVFQPNLKWTKQCTEIISRLKTRLAGLRKVQGNLSLQKHKVMAHSIFLPILSYCIVL